MKLVWTNQASVLAALESFPDIFEDELKHALEVAADILVGAVREAAPSSSGTLASLINHQGVDRTTMGYNVKIGDPTEYGEAIEYGRHPGSKMPPVFALTGNFEQLDQWVWSHRQYFDDVETEEDASEIAYLIALKIARNGFASAPDGPGKGWGMYSKAADPNGDAVRQVMQVLAAARRNIEARCQQAVA